MAKVLVADDSLTIQKVVGITMANGPYELTECHNEDELKQNLSSDQFDLLLLDFNLSENRVGYELAAEVHQNFPNLPILVMLGTFDSVDEAQLDRAGVAGKIVKPFESQKFLAVCQQVIEEGSPLDSTSYNDEAFNEGQDIEDEFQEELERSDESDDVGDQWVVDSPAVEESVSFDEPTPQASSGDRLNDEVNDWGMNIPGVIGESTGPGQIPPVIESAELEQPQAIEEHFEEPEPESEPEQEEEEEEKVPEEDDLAYPEMDAFGATPLAAPTSAPELTSIDDFAPDDDDSSDMDLGEDTAPNYQLEQGGGASTDTAQLQEDLAHENEDDFWAVDEVIDSGPVPEGTSDPISLDQLEEQLHHDEPEESEEEIQVSLESQPISEPVSGPAPIAMDEEHIAEMIKDKISPLIVDLVKEYCQQNVEKIAWEVIPDLAENLIKEEIRNISERTSQN